MYQGQKANKLFPDGRLFEPEGGHEFRLVAGVCIVV